MGSIIYSPQNTVNLRRLTAYRILTIYNSVITELQKDLFIFKY